MTVDTRTRFDVVPLSKHIGAEIRGLDLREKPDEETAAPSIGPGSIISSLSSLARPSRRKICSA